jgi:hypothetical protein
MLSINASGLLESCQSRSRKTKYYSIKERKMETKEIVYFEKRDRQNIDEMVKIARKRAEDAGVKTVVIAWSTGYTFNKFREIARNSDFNIVAFTNPRGASFPIFIQPTDSNETKKRKEEQLSKGITELPAAITDELREEYEKEGIKVGYLMPDFFNLKTTLSENADYRDARAQLATFGVPAGLDLLDLDTGVDLSPLNMMSQGFRVSIGCAILAVKNGLVPEGETVLAIAGMSTAVILQVSSEPGMCLVREIIGFERTRPEDVHIRYRK